jgi:type II secretory pathway pseudopilin PulG
MTRPAPRPRARRRPGARGYLLAEIMIALVVFSFAVVGLITALSSSMEASTTMQKDRQLRFALQTHIAMMKTRQVLFGENTYPVGDTPFEVVEKVEPLDATIDAPNVGKISLDKMFIVHLTCRRAGDTKGDALEEEVYVYQP